jgi:anthranilate 1,2-dioxygenase small subunit/terephthalate 1,2-dioxygenase oxygenase component beta subunit
MGIPCILGQEGEATLAHTSFMVARIMSTGQTDVFATGYFKDRFIRAENTAQASLTNGVLLAERVVVCDSTVTDTLLAIPL